MSSPASFDPASCRTRVCASVSQDAALQDSCFEWLPLKHSDCAAVVLEDDVGPLAVMTFLEDSAQTLSILNWRCLRRLPFPSQQRIIPLLLRAIITESKAREFRHVRYLNWRKGRRDIHLEEPALAKSGFLKCVSSSVWKPVQSLIDTRRRAMTASERTGDFCLVDLQHQLRNPHRTGQLMLRQIETLINRVSDDSDDIARLPRPNPNELLKDWLSRPARALIADINQQPTGIVVWSETAAEDCVEVMFEYLGIAPNHRRKSMATTLLLNALDQIHRDHLQMPVEVSVLVDQSNRRANQFYHAVGFRRSTWSIDVWLHTR